MNESYKDWTSLRLDFIQLWKHVKKRRKKQFSILLVGTIFASFSEMISIGAAIPFLGALVAPEVIFENIYFKPFIYLFGITKPEQILMPLTIVFGVGALLAGLMRMIVLWATTRLSFATGHDLGIDIFAKTLHQPYEKHLNRNSSEVINGISMKIDRVIFFIILPFINIVTSFLLLIFILLALFSINPLISLVTFGSFGLIYFVIASLSKKQLLLNGKILATESTNRIKALQEGLGGIRDVLIDNSQHNYTEVFKDADYPMRRAQGRNVFLNQSPRYGMEALGMVAIAALAFTLSQIEGNAISFIPVLGTVALGAQRLLPALQQLYGSWSLIQDGRAVFKDALDLLSQTIPDQDPLDEKSRLPFNNKIEFKDVSFAYEGSEEEVVLKDINFSIKKGDCIGIVGKTGSGKSTLLDILMCLLQPSDGSILIDGVEITEKNKRAWQTNIAHVPQSIFLPDSTVEESIAFGRKKEIINHERVVEVARKASLSKAIEEWPKKYQTIVGERGEKLSGGQRQRIGIARALYKKADVIIFDEATSALDSETESEVLKSIQGLEEELTIIMVAHRVSTLNKCNKIIEINDKTIVNKTDYTMLTEQQ